MRRRWSPISRSRQASRRHEARVTRPGPLRSCRPPHAAPVLSVELSRRNAVWEAARAARLCQVPPRRASNKDREGRVSCASLISISTCRRRHIADAPGRAARRRAPARRRSRRRLRDRADRRPARPAAARATSWCSTTRASSRPGSSAGAAPRGRAHAAPAAGRRTLARLRQGGAAAARRATGSSSRRRPTTLRRRDRRQEPGGRGDAALRPRGRGAARGARSATAPCRCRPISSARPAATPRDASRLSDDLRRDATARSPRRPLDCISPSGY